MAFPETRHTLIQRLVATGDEDDWRQFMEDYWRPVCRFALRRGLRNLDDAEDIASLMFTALLSSDLLRRWLDRPRAKLRTLLCVVTRNVISSRARVDVGRQRLLAENRNFIQSVIPVEVDTEPAVPDDQLEAFYAAWVEDIVQEAVDQMLEETLRTGHSDRFRVLYGRICERMAMKQIAELLGIAVSTAENDFRQAKKRLADILEQLVRRRVERYAAPADVMNEFRSEWQELGQFLEEHGGIETALQRAHERVDAYELKSREFAATTRILRDAGRLGEDSLRPRNPRL